MRHPRRTAISLLEVLICIGIVAIGLLSVAALIPVGGVQVQKANVQERKAALGLNAFREFQVRGMDKPPNASRMTDGTYNPNSDCAWVAAAGPGSQLFSFNTSVTPNRWTANFALPFAIDPLMVSVAGSAVDSFPAIAPSGSPILKRLSLASTYNASQPTYRSLADTVFTAADDVVTNLPDDRSQIGTGALDSSSSHRDYNGQFTWLATHHADVPEWQFHRSGADESVHAVDRRVRSAHHVDPGSGHRRTRPGRNRIGHVRHAGNRQR